MTRKKRKMTVAVGWDRSEEALAWCFENVGAHGWGASALWSFELVYDYDDDLLGHFVYAFKHERHAVEFKLRFG